MILVDSTVWIDLLRREETVAVSRLRRLLDRGEAAVAAVVVQEILQGATDPAALAKLLNYFTSLPMLGIGQPLELHIAAARLYARARWQGITPRSPHDCVIAAAAVEHEVLLLHDDKDFERLVEVEPKLKLVPRR